LSLVVSAEMSMEEEWVEEEVEEEVRLAGLCLMTCD